MWQLLHSCLYFSVFLKISKKVKKKFHYRKLGKYKKTKEKKNYPES